MWREHGYIYQRLWKTVHTHVTANGAKFPVRCDGLCILNREASKSKVHVEETGLDSHTLIDGWEGWTDSQGEDEADSKVMPWKSHGSWRPPLLRGRRKNPLDTKFRIRLIRCRSKFSHSCRSRIDLLTALAVTFTLTCPRHSLGHVFFFPCCVPVYIYIPRIGLSLYPLFSSSTDRHTHTHWRDRGGKKTKLIFYFPAISQQRWPKSFLKLVRSSDHTVVK